MWFTDKVKNVKNNVEARWPLGKEKVQLENNLKTLAPSDQLYKDTLSAREQIGRIQNEKLKSCIETGAKVVGTVGILVLGALAYGKDKNDEILSNKNTHNFVSKFLKF